MPHRRRPRGMRRRRGGGRGRPRSRPPRTRARARRALGPKPSSRRCRESAGRASGESPPDPLRGARAPRPWPVLRPPPRSPAPCSVWRCACRWQRSLRRSLPSSCREVSLRRRGDPRDPSGSEAPTVSTHVDRARCCDRSPRSGTPRTSGYRARRPSPRQVLRARRPRRSKRPRWRRPRIRRRRPWR